jgi:hypothetical protein
VKYFKELFKNYTIDYGSKPDAAKQMDTYQLALSCCGEDGPDDYAGRLTPDSCKGHKKGCTIAIEEVAAAYWLIIVIALFSTAFIALIGMVISMMLCCALRDEYD